MLELIREQFEILFSLGLRGAYQQRVVQLGVVVAGVYPAQDTVLFKFSEYLTDRSRNFEQSFMEKQDIKDPHDARNAGELFQCGRVGMARGSCLGESARPDQRR